MFLLLTFPLLSAIVALIKYSNDSHYRKEGPHLSDLKYSRQREAIRENLLHRCDHPTADQIYEDIRKIYPRISLGTVYRNLSLLHEMGEINKVTTANGSVHFDGDLSDHQHFICDRCGKIQDLLLPTPADWMQAATRNIAGTVRHCKILLHGTCRECSSL